VIKTTTVKAPRWNANGANDKESQGTRLLRCQQTYATQIVQRSGKMGEGGSLGVHSVTLGQGSDRTGNMVNNLILASSCRNAEERSEGTFILHWLDLSCSEFRRS